MSGRSTRTVLRENLQIQRITSWHVASHESIHELPEHVLHPSRARALGQKHARLHRLFLQRILCREQIALSHWNLTDQVPQGTVLHSRWNTGISPKCNNFHMFRQICETGKHGQMHVFWSIFSFSFHKRSPRLLGRFIRRAQGKATFRRAKVTKQGRENCKSGLCWQAQT